MLKIENKLMFQQVLDIIVKTLFFLQKSCSIELKITKILTVQPDDEQKFNLILLSKYYFFPAHLYIAKRFFFHE